MSVNLILSELSTLYSAVVSDACDRIGLRQQTADPGLDRMSGPSTGALIGWVRTARSVVRTELDDPPYRGEIDLVDSLRPDDVVIADVEDESSAFWGELFSAAAIGRGARGLVVSGVIRDLDRVRELGFPIFASGTRPTDCQGRIAVVERDCEMHFRGVLVRTGDLVVADADGVVFVPKAALPKVTEIALAKARTESEAKRLLLAGGTLADVWARHRVL